MQCLLFCAMLLYNAICCFVQYWVRHAPRRKKCCVKSFNVLFVFLLLAIARTYNVSNTKLKSNVHKVTINLMSYHIVAYHIVPYRTVSYRTILYCIVSYRTVLHPIASNHVVLHCTISISTFCIALYHIVSIGSHCIVPYCLVSCRISSYCFLRYLTVEYIWRGRLEVERKTCKM